MSTIPCIFILFSKLHQLKGQIHTYLDFLCACLFRMTSIQKVVGFDVLFVVKYMSMF